MRKCVFVSRSGKNGSIAARRVLDRFAVRSGDDTWMTSISQAGLARVRTALQAVASRNMAVACHIVADGRLRLQWVVGNRRRFSRAGASPLHQSAGEAAVDTRRPAVNLPLLIRCAGAAAQLHDVGKTARQMQAKIAAGQIVSDAVRHELVTLLLLEHGGSWPAAGLAPPSLDPCSRLDIAFPDSEPKLIRWLIASHHRLPAAGNCSGHHVNAGQAANLADCLSPATAQLPTGGRFAERHDAALRQLTASSGHAWEPELAVGMALQSRLVLQLADQLVSASADSENPLPPLANSRQSLDDHLQATAAMVAPLARLVAHLAEELPGLCPGDLEQLNRPATGRFAWQAEGARAASAGRGNFIVVCSGTGSGKTRGCARIMATLSPRLTVLLGLRTLTLQTGQVYRRELGLGSETLTVQIGSREIKTLYGEPEEEVFCDGTPFKLPRLLGALAPSTDAAAYLGAPVLVATADQVMRAADWSRGGHLLATLRVASSDLILDEFDDYALGDLAALARLAWLTGFFGNNLLLSSATAMPEMVAPLEDAYRSGRRCHSVLTGADADVATLFVSDRLPPAGGAFGVYAGRLARARRRDEAKTTYRRGLVADVATADGMLEQALELHRQNHQTAADGIRCSAGLVRLARINDVAALCLALNRLKLPEGVVLGILPYHSRLPLSVRAHTERLLDDSLKRGGAWRPDDSRLFARHLGQARAQGGSDVIILAVCSPVIEVGRDLCFDHGIIEPSSARSIVQTRGRVNRHLLRPLADGCYNTVVLRHNLSWLRTGGAIAFERPGFEGVSLRDRRSEPFPSHDLADIAPRLVAGDSAGCLAPATDGEDLLPRWERERIGAFLAEANSLLLESPGEGLLTTAHLGDYRFRAGRPQQPVYCRDGGWYHGSEDRQDINLGSCQACPGWAGERLVIDRDDLPAVMAETAVRADLDQDDAALYHRYHQVAVEEWVIDKRDDYAFDELLGVFRLKGGASVPSIFAQAPTC